MLEYEELTTLLETIHQRLPRVRKWQLKDINNDTTAINFILYASKTQQGYYINQELRRQAYTALSAAHWK